MDDPLNDPRFPDRPQSQEFWHLADVVLSMDAEPDLNAKVDALFGPDVDALFYVALHRVTTASQRLYAKYRNVSDSNLGSAAWVDGFIAGCIYTNRHKDM